MCNVGKLGQHSDHCLEKSPPDRLVRHRVIAVKITLILGGEERAADPDIGAPGGEMVNGF